MLTTNVIPFPGISCREPVRQAMTSEGMPVRKGDSVIITDTANRKFAGTVSKVGTADLPLATCQVYEVICNDGRSRVVTADQIEALS